MKNQYSLKSGDLVFFRGYRLWSKIIQFRSRSKWSHVGIIVKIQDWTMVLEAIEGGGVRLVPFFVWTNWRGEIGIYKVNNAYGKLLTNTVILEFGLPKCGQQYASTRQFIRSFSCVWHWITKRFRLSSDIDKERWFCSELVSTLLQENGYPIGKSPQELTPGDVSRLSFVVKQYSIH